MIIVSVREKDLTIKTPLAPLYVLYGKQAYLIQLLKERIIEKALSKDEQDFNLSTYNLLEEPVEAAVEDAMTLPFIGEKRVIILEHAYILTAAKPKTKIEQKTSVLEKYINNTSPDTVMIFITDSEKLDQRKKLVKVLKGKGEVIELSQLSESLAYSLLKETALTFGVHLSESAHQLLLQRIGFNLQVLAKEVEKLSLYAGEQGEITRESVELLSVRSLDDNIFALSDHVLKQEPVKAFKLLNDLIVQKEETIKLLALLTRQFRIMFQVKQYSGAGYTQKNMAEKLKLHPYSVKLAAEQSVRFSMERLENALIQCTETDFLIKSGQIDKERGFEILIHRLCH